MDSQKVTATYLKFYLGRGNFLRLGKPGLFEMFFTNHSYSYMIISCEVLTISILLAS